MAHKHAMTEWHTNMQMTEWHTNLQMTEWHTNLQMTMAHKLFANDRMAHKPAHPSYNRNLGNSKYAGPNYEHFYVDMYFHLRFLCQGRDKELW